MSLLICWLHFFFTGLCIISWIHHALPWICIYFQCSVEPAPLLYRPCITSAFKILLQSLLWSLPWLQPGSINPINSVFLWHFVYAATTVELFISEVTFFCVCVCFISLLPFHQIVTSLFLYTTFSTDSQGPKRLRRLKLSSYLITPSCVIRRIYIFSKY